jgi:cytochrome c oxidase subunit 4
MVTVKTYYVVFGSLLALTLLTAGAAYVDLGAQWNVVVALGIAVIKASLVAAFFMHLRYSRKLTLLIAGAGLIWMLQLFVLSFADYLTRGW